MPTIHPVSTSHNHDGVYAPIGSTSSVTVQDEGTPLTARGTINFTGDGVSAADDAVNERTNVTISGGGVTDHGALTGLADDDHPQYLLTTGKAADSDLLDSHDASYFATAGHNHDADYLGITAKAADSDLLDSHDTAYFATADHNHDHGALTGLADDDHPQYVKHSLATAVSDFLVASGAGAFVKKTLAEVKTILGLGSMAYTNVDGWIPVSSTWTYASATTITVPSGAAAIYKVGQGIRLTANGVVLQAYITGVADTLLTTAGDALTNHTFSAISYTNTPGTAIGFPVWFNHAATVTYNGGTTNPTSCGGGFKYSINGRVVTLIGTNECVTGTGNRTFINWTLPVAPGSGLSGGVSVDSSMSGAVYATGGRILGGLITARLSAAMTGNFYIWISATYGI